MCEVRGRNEILVGRRARVVRTSRLEGKPVAEVEPLLPEKTVARLRALVLDPRAHTCVLTHEDTRVAVRLEDGPRNDNRHVGPTRARRHASARSPENIGNHPGNRAIRLLVRSDVGQPLREESGDVRVERRGGREHLRVAGPAESLVALRTVGGDIQEVAALSPHDVVLELVDERVGCLERARRRHIRVNNDACDRIERRRAGKSVDCDVSKSLKSEMRLVDFDAFAFQNVFHRLRRVAQIFRVEVPRLVEHLGVAQAYDGAGRSAHL